MKVLVTKISGLHCDSCLNLIDRLGREHGAVKVDIKLQTMIGKLYYDSIEEKAFLEAVTAKGYHIEKLTIYDESEIE